MPEVHRSRAREKPRAGTLVRSAGRGEICKSSRQRMDAESCFECFRACEGMFSLQFNRSSDFRGLGRHEGLARAFAARASSRSVRSVSSAARRASVAAFASLRAAQTAASSSAARAWHLSDPGHFYPQRLRILFGEN